MRSRLEARVAALLDEMGVPWEYEPVCFASEEGQYLPDFRLWGGTYLEVKPPNTTADEIEATKGRMETILASDHLAVLWLMLTDGVASFGSWFFFDDFGWAWRAP